MTTKSDIAWFKSQFFTQMDAAVQGTPLTVDFLTALACQETGSIWPFLRTEVTDRKRLLALCVGDTLDGRSAFPTSLAELKAWPRGKEMFEMARQSLVDMAQFVPGFQAVALRPNKYCHAFGVFQVDIQHFKTEPDYFLDRTWATFEGSLGRAMGILKQAWVRRGFDGRTGLSDFDLATIGIVYNTGRFKPGLGLQQGHKPPDGPYYGQSLFDLLRLVHTVSGPDPHVASMQAPAPGRALVAPPTPVSGDGHPMKVAVSEGMLRVRAEPLKSDPLQANVLAHLPDGHPVRARGAAKKGFIEIETSFMGAHVQGFASKAHLVADEPAQAIEVLQPSAVPPKTGIVAVDMPEKAGLVTTRKGVATARSLNEKGAPSRTGTTPEELRASLAALIAWLAVDDPQFVRYQPRNGSTFCNIYAHDYCKLAGVYLPRVWWTSRALLQLETGVQVAPLLGATIVELRANDLFRWLRDFGPGFGWRQTGTLTKLQTEVNQGAVGLIVARRKEDGRSGHIVMVVPETDTDTARRDANAQVIAPLQSQAGARNFRYGRGTPNWWLGDQFAESAFWLHA
uniref:hypothetical protein n=1 Tax=unclassified Variovorax TaxID=663243 RepID=UPI000D39407E